MAKVWMLAARLQSRPLMSALGQNQTSAHVRVNFRFTPKSRQFAHSIMTSALCQKRTSAYSFKHPVGAVDGYLPTPSLTGAGVSDPNSFLSAAGRATAAAVY
jgi:hypothetical protein